MSDRESETDDLKAVLKEAIENMNHYAATLELTEHMCKEVIAGRAEMFVKDDKLLFRMTDEKSLEEAP
jgi:hypothetical protein